MFFGELEDIRVAEAIVGIRDWPNTAQRSHTLDTIPETQDPEVDMEVNHVGATCHVSCDPDSTTLPMHSTPGTH